MTHVYDPAVLSSLEKFNEEMKQRFDELQAHNNNVNDKVQDLYGII